VGEAFSLDRRGWKAAPTEKDLTYLEVSGFLTYQIQSRNGAMRETSLEGLNRPIRLS
jgi:hypothetical protein